jgi:pimeloyl-ACP methyl ester carboxylesterase
VIFVHGLATNLAFWYLAVVPRLGGDYAWTIYDLRGHGASGVPPSGYTTADMAGDLAALLDYLEVRRAHVVGHSFGGAVALHYALLYPERVSSLTLADALIRAFQPVQHVQDPLAEIRDFADPDAKGIPFQPFGLWKTSAQSGRRWFDLIRTTTVLDDICALEGLTADRIGRLSPPLLAMFGEYSHCLPSCWGLRAQVPSAQIVIVPGVGHFHPLRRPRYFAEQLQRFISVAQPTHE